jgi:hypothetical protein
MVINPVGVKQPGMGTSGRLRRILTPLFPPLLDFPCRYVILLP